MNSCNDMNVIFRKNIIFLDKKTKNELKKYEYIQNYEEEKFVKQNIHYKERSIEILKEKIIYCDQLIEIPTFSDSGYFDDNRKRDVLFLQKILEQFNKLTLCNLCNEPLSDNIKVPALYDCNHTVCDKCYFKNSSECPFCGMLNVNKTLKINIALADLINNFTKLANSQINPIREETKSLIITESTPEKTDSFNPQISQEINLNLNMNQATKEDLNILRRSNTDIRRRSLSKIKSIVNAKTTTLAGHSNYVWSLIKISEKIIASGGGDDQIKIWDLTTNECIKTIKNLNSLSALIKLNENEIAIGSEDSDIKILNIYSGDVVKNLKGHTDSIWSLARIDKNTIASGSEDKSIKIWDIENEQCVKTLSGHTEFVWTLLKLNKEKIVSASGDDSIRIWNVKTGECLFTKEGLAHLVWSLIKIDENSIALGGGDEETVKIWDINTWECVKVLKGFGSICSLIKFNDTFIISGGDDSSIKIWDFHNGGLLKTLKGHSDSVRSLLKINQNVICSGSADNTIKIWRNFMDHNDNVS